MKKLRLTFKSIFLTFLLSFSMTLIACGGGGGDSDSDSENSVTKYTVTLAQPANGSIAASPEIPADGMVASGTVITFTATPDTNYRVGDWSGATVNSGKPNEATITVGSDVTVTVCMNKIKYTVTLAQPVNGSITADPTIPSNGKVASGTVITFTASPDDATYMVKSWTGAVHMTGNMEKATLTVSENIEVSAIISKDTIPNGFVFVVPPANAFVTDLEEGSTDNPVYNSGGAHRGVFYKRRKVKLSPYCIGKTEVTYKLWKEVYDWATGDSGGAGQPAEKYTFESAGHRGWDESSGSELPNSPENNLTLS